MSNFLTEVWTNGNEDAIFNEFDGVATGLWPDEAGIDPNGFLQYYRALSPLVHDLKFEFLKWHEEGDKLWLSWMVRGKHWKKSENLIAWPGAASTRFRNGKLVECNNFQDFMILFSQLDLVPEQAFEYGLAGADLLEEEERRIEELPPSAHGRSHFLWPGLRKLESSGREIYLPCSSQELTVLEASGFALPADEQLEILFESATFSMVVVDHADKILEVDESFATLVDRLPRSLPGLLFHQLLHPQDQTTEHALFSELISGRRNHYRHRARLMRGRAAVWVQLSVARVPAEGGGSRIVRAVQETSRVEELVAFQETERKALSSELHDALARELATLWVYLQTGRHNLEPTPILIDRCLKVVERMSNDLRTQMRELRSPILEGKPLSQALRTLAERATRDSGVILLLDLPSEIDQVDHTTALLAYRVVQEALQNVVAHSDTDRCDIRLERGEGKLMGTITDDGRGFDILEATSKGGLGLLGMRQRCELVGGRFELDASPGRGTRITFEVESASKTAG